MQRPISSRVAPMTKRFVLIWDAIFDQYGVIVDEKELDQAFGAVRSYYEYKIRETYDADFRWDECRKNNLALSENTENFMWLPDLVSHMRKEGLLPQLMFDINSGYIIKRINEAGGANVKPATTLWDLHGDAHLLKLILDIPFSLHGKKPIPLGALCGDSPKVLKTIKLTDIIRQTLGNDSYVNIVMWAKKLPDYCPQQNVLLEVKQTDGFKTEPFSFLKTLQGLRLVPGKGGASERGASEHMAALDHVASLLSPKSLVIQCNWIDCIDDFQIDRGEIDTNPIRYFYNKFREKRGLDMNGSILDAIYEKQVNDGAVIIIFELFERLLFGKFATKTMGALKKTKETPVVSVLVTINLLTETFLRNKFPYLRVFRLKELYKEGIRGHLKVNGITLGEGCEGTFLNNPLHLSMVKEICNENRTQTKDGLTKIGDVYDEFITHCMVAKGRSVDLLTHAALTYIFPEKHRNVGINFREEFPHQTIAEYLIAMWIYDSKNSNRTKEFLPIIFSSYKYNGIYKFLIETLCSDPQSSKTDPWKSVPPLVWGILSCVHSSGEELKKALYGVDTMVLKMGTDAFKNTLSNCPLVDLTSVRLQYGDELLAVAFRYKKENLVKVLVEIGVLISCPSRCTPQQQLVSGETPSYLTKLLNFYYCINFK